MENVDAVIYDDSDDDSLILLEFTSFNNLKYYNKNPTNHNYDSEIF